MQPKKLQPEQATHEGTPLAQLLRQPLKLFDATVRPAQREDPEDAWFNEGGATMWPAQPQIKPQPVPVEFRMTFEQYKRWLGRKYEPPRIRRICPVCGMHNCPADPYS